MRIFGLMGDSLTAPQDTVTAYWAAIGAGADGIMIGVRLTRDNQLVCLSHDTLSETCGDPRSVEDITASALARLDAGATFRSTVLDHENQPTNNRGRDVPWRGGKWPLDHPMLRDVLSLFARRSEIGISLPAEIPEARLWILLNEVIGLCNNLGVDNKVWLAGGEDVCSRIRQIAPHISTAMVADPGKTPMENVVVASDCGASHMLIDIERVASRSTNGAQPALDHDLAACLGEEELQLLLTSSFMPFVPSPAYFRAVADSPHIAGLIVRSPLHAVALRDRPALVASDSFAGTRIDRKLWSAGYSSINMDTRIFQKDGLQISIKPSGSYSGAGTVTAYPVHDRFDARIGFRVDNPMQGTTFELAAIGIDAGYHNIDNSGLNSRKVNLTFDVHGAPPYASSERDEADGFRCGWNNSHTPVAVDEDWTARTLNMFNKYGRDVGHGGKDSPEGHLRLVRNGPVFVSYYKDKFNEGWVCSGAMLVSNLGRDVFLRLAGKHWSKGGKTPPANEFAFSNFELYQFRGSDAHSMRSGEMKDRIKSREKVAAAHTVGQVMRQSGKGNGATVQGAKGKDVPPEVRLVSDVKSCRTCKWFWGDIPPYGPYPSYDWKKRFPAKVCNGGGKGLKVVTAGYNVPEPAVMHGCRKAPIMTIGINPNLGAYFQNIEGAMRTYPAFEDEASYAYYYRYKTLHQERFDRALIENNLCKDKVKAKKDGVLKSVTRSNTHRWMVLEVQYDGEAKPELIELSWSPEARYVVSLDRVYSNKPAPFKKGDTIAARLRMPVGEKTSITKIEEKYYMRFTGVLDRFKRLSGGPLEKAPLSIGEDVAMHDMIACASPGWTKEKFKIPQDRVADNCVMTNGFVLKQFLQSRPRLVVIVGSSSLKMFRKVFGDCMSDFDYVIDEPDPDKPGETKPVQKEIYQLLRETTRRKHYVDINIDSIRFKSRIITPPHFSYDDNFRQHSRFSVEAWEGFKKDFRDDYELLKENDRIWRMTWNGYQPIRIEGGKNDEIRKEISSVAWDVLMAYYYDPIEMMAKVLAEEYKEGIILYDEKLGHLIRTDGPCNFCVNDLWTFPEGCPYGKPDEKHSSVPEQLDRAVQEILGKTAPTAPTV